MRLIALAAFVVLAAGCPDRDELVDQVGGAPGRQVNDARTRIKAAETKAEARATAASTDPSDK